MVIPGAPEHAAVARNTNIELKLTWDASPSLPADLLSYTVYYKLSTDPLYPATPQITRTDILPNYTENISVTSGVSYNFIVYANSVSGLRSTDNCASCRVTYTPPSGGGSNENIDSIAPNPGIASSPPYANNSPITVTYSGASDTGGSGLNYVELLVKKGTGNWQNTSLTSSSGSGSFDFMPEAGLNTTYSFDLKAIDNQGNQSTDPTATGDTTTIYDTQAPTINKIVIPTSATSAPILISYENAVDVGVAGLGHVELWYQKGVTGTWTDSGLTSTTASGSFIFSGLTDSDYYYFDLIAVDRAGNRSVEDAETKIPLMYDYQPPVMGSVSVPAESVTSPIVVGYAGATDVGPAGLKKVELWHKKESSGTWTNSGLSLAGTNGSFNFVPTASNGTYYFEFVLEDKLGNRSTEPAGQGSASILYNAESVVAVLSNLPAATIPVGSVNIGVGGNHIAAYKYKLNNGSYSDETPIAQNIILTNLPEGDYALSVIGKNIYNQWQDVLSPTTASWKVLFPVTVPPVATEGENEPPPPTPPPVTEPPPTPPVIEPTIPPIIPSNEGFPTDPPVTEPPSVEQPSTGTAEVYSPEVVEKTPEITPPAPAIHRSAAEIQTKAVEAVQNRPTVSETPATIALPRTPQLVLTRIDECRLTYPSVNFDLAALDSDGDGLANKTECYAGTNPLVSDTDGDQCLDGDEINQYSTNPLNPKDCKPQDELKSITISSPQAGWLIAELEITGLTPNTTSRVNLVAFPVVEGKPMPGEGVKLGIINRFSLSSIEGQYFFKTTPEALLQDGETYDLVAIGELTDGKTITSQPVRFSLDSKNAASPPVPISIGNVPITNDLKLKNIQIRPNSDGRVQVVGESEYGAQVFAVWESIVLASSVIADSTLGEFAIESPGLLTPGQNHQVTLYAVKETDGQKLRSKNVKINFYIQTPTSTSHWLWWLILLLILLATWFIFYLKRRRKKEKEKEARKLARL